MIKSEPHLLSKSLKPPHPGTFFLVLMWLCHRDFSLKVEICMHNIPLNTGVIGKSYKFQNNDVQFKMELKV